MAVELPAAASTAMLLQAGIKHSTACEPHIVRNAQYFSPADMLQELAPNAAKKQSYELLV